MKKLLNFLFPCLLYPILSASASDHVMTLTSNLTLPNLQKQCSFELDYRNIHLLGDDFLILNPRVKLFGNNHFSTSLGMGYRKDLVVDMLGLDGMIGAHLYADHCYMYKSHHFQIGPSLEYLGKKWDFRTNGYFPLKTYVGDNGKTIEKHNYFDTEVAYKFGMFDVGLSYNLDISAMKHGACTRFSTHFGDCSLSVLCGSDSIHGKHTQISVSFDFPVGKKSEAKRTVRNVEIVAHRIAPRSVIRSVFEVKPKPVVLPGAQPEKPKSGWLDFFFSRQNGSGSTIQ